MSQVTLPQANVVYDDVADDGYFDVVVVPDANWLYAQVLDYDWYNASIGSLISDASFSADPTGTQQIQAMYVDPPIDYMGVYSAFSIFNRYMSFSDAGSNQGGFPFGAYLPDPANNNPGIVESVPHAASRRKVISIFEDPLPIVLTLSFSNPTASHIPIFEGAAVRYVASRKAKGYWFSRASGTVAPPAPKNAFWILQKANPQTWQLLMQVKKSNSIQTSVTYKYILTPGAKTVLPIVLTLQGINPHPGTWPTQVTVSA